MKMFAQCKSPIWRTDDLSPCFQADYLQTLFPLLACAISFLFLLSQFILHRVQKQQRKRHSILVDISEEDDASIDVEEDDDDSLARLTLQKTYSHGKQGTKDVDRPTGEVFLVAIEFLLVLGQLVLNIVNTLDTSNRRRRASIAETVVSAYLSILAGARLLSTTTTWVSPIQHLWDHSTALYATQWLTLVWVFRSVLVHPLDRLPQITTITSFVITSILVLITLCSRKGNRGVLLEYEGDIEPSREPLASILSLATFTWVDPIVWRGYKKTLELTDVWNVTLADKAETVLAHFRQIKKTHSLAVRLLLHFKTELLIQGAWAGLGSIFMFVPTLLLKAILEYLEDSEKTPISAAWLYVVLLFATGIIQAVSDGQGLWIGRKICIQIRAIIVGEIYSKTLRRKAAASTEDDPEKEPPKEKQTLLAKVKSFWTMRGKKARDLPQLDSSLKKATTTQAKNGTVINLMSIDSFKVAEICSYLHFLWAATPVQLAMAVGLLYRVLGFSSFVGIVLMVLLLPLNFFIANSFQAAQKRIMTATDARIHVTNEVLQNIRIIKYFAWEQRFQNNVNEKRKIELSALWRKYVLWASAATIWSAVPILITFASFLIYTKVEKRPLVPSVAFPALSMFSLLRIPLDQLADMVAHIQESKVSVDRVEQFLDEEETEKYSQLRYGRRRSLPTTRIALDNATLTWSTSSSDAAEAFRLINANVDFPIGQLSVIAGPTGSGKTSLLMALLGEMKLLRGNVYIPGGSVRQDLRPDTITGLTESVAYCAQQAWLVNATIKDNILFASPYDDDRYHEVISVCALERDLEILDAGDATLVGEKGITMSGGQKQRISLARAIYSNSKHLLLDDCLSAVDAHTAKHIFEKALTGDLMAHRTCILVSHNVALTVPFAAHLVVLENGKITAQGSPEEIAKSGALGDELLKSRPVSRGTSRAPSRVPSNLEEETSKLSGGNGHVTPESGKTARIKAKLNKPEKSFVDTRIEAKATGSVKFSTIKMYLQAMGPWWYWIFAAFGFIATQVGSVATNVWIRQWANAYHLRHTDRSHAAVHGFHHVHSMTSASSLGRSSLQTPQTAPGFWILEKVYDVDAWYYLGIYALIGMAYVAICFGREIILFLGSQRASWHLHEKLLTSILRAKFRFFDSTPLGQLTNRFSKDIQSLDQEVAPVAIGLLHSAASVLTIVILISVITPAFLIPGFFITIMYVLTGLLYIRSSRDLKRIEAVQRSPLFQHFGETLSGVVTIRAYGDESRFIQESHLRVNTHNRPFIYLWATNRWLALRIDVAGALVSFFSGMFVVLKAGSIDPGAAGLALSYAITFTQNVLWLVRLYAANEQNMNAVERLQEYINVEQEASSSIPETKPASNWPSHGAVEFIGYSTRYRSDLDPVLKTVTFRIDPGQKVGIVGRTGAGKSSLALALFRGLEAEEGKILIDDVDIGLIGLQDLREAITIVPQDPTLFTGTLRSNLDPFELFTDEEVFMALRRVQLISGPKGTSDRSGAETPSEPSSQSPTIRVNGANTDSQLSANGTINSESTLVQVASNARDNKNIFHDLSSPIAESGSNLSQGQRQLLCLARALLKAPKILVMDEATASIDYATDSKIQDTLRELKNNTILTIAHRLQTIVDYDRVLVLDKGEVKEYAHPWELIQQEDGLFRSMCQTSGEFDSLYELAKKAWQDGRLVDDS
ncbi:Transporter of the ATP-binding cassette (ABC) [Elasticomyces elasticus]|uniref:Transporter of the ATP-binding cassette (ABC) n=1 Tax=Exophiala sideris TaxID=1016849 RepID=A0ABR0JEN4_9EURO|nr:Transporter of the ATP-binding cassette (ABC) [Elasticomyces elasticus]KAK5032642.1 Transporter of the ATP-binding cassette (ABC) [Exophiala sideris]KAK5062167.1 Transporter of the ATP-binding cassette (ABC) [Exophiala sideris]